MKITKISTPWNFPAIRYTVVMYVCVIAMATKPFHFLKINTYTCKLVKTRRCVMDGFGSMKTSSGATNVATQTHFNTTVHGYRPNYPAANLLQL